MMNIVADAHAWPVSVHCAGKYMCVVVTCVVATRMVEVHIIYYRSMCVVNTGVVHGNRASGQKKFCGYGNMTENIC